MNKAAFVGFLVACFSTIGCISSDSSCANIDQSAVVDNGSPILSTNEPCSVHADCLSDECVPTIESASGFEGVCWSDSFSGCELVDFEQWVIDDMCNGRALAVCQVLPDVDIQANCLPLEESAAPWIANFMCCDSSFL